MHLTGSTWGQFRSRRVAGVCPLAVAALVTAGCAAASNPTQTAAAPAVVVLGLPTSPESTLMLTRRALGEIGGTLQATQWQKTIAVLSTRLTANSRSAGTREIAVVASVARSVRDSLKPETLVELRAWAMDSIPIRRGMAGAVTSENTRVTRPRPVTFDDTEDWENVEVVMTLLMQRGGRRVR